MSPYIPYHIRLRLANKDAHPSNIGELNYSLTKQLLQWIGHNESYTKYNEVIGLLECMKMELYRKRVAKYEDIKEKANGKVY